MMRIMRIAVVADEDGADRAGRSPRRGRLQPLAPDGSRLGPAEPVADLAAAIAARERTDRPRWVWAASDALYPGLLRSGTRVAACHDVALVEALLLSREGQFGRPRSVAAVWARLHGLPVPEDPRPMDAQHASSGAQQSLFGPAAPSDSSPDSDGEPVDPLDQLVEAHADQLRRMRTEHDPASDPTPGPTRSPKSGPRSGSNPAPKSGPASGLPSGPAPLELLAAAESAGGLAAVEMTFAGLPWNVAAHDALLTELLGPRPFAQAPPVKLAELAIRIGAAFGHPPGGGFNPDSPAQVLRAFGYAGIPLKTTRSWELRAVDHPAAALLLDYKELSRIHSANGWAWQDAWVAEGRFRPEYLVGGVVSGRWATRGGGALQLPRLLRRAVLAEEGWSLVVADAGQLEPRVLAAVSRDGALARAAGAGDLYAALAEEVFDGDRPSAKLGLLSAMYGQTSGGAGQLLPVMRRRFPAALAYVEAAAQAGQEGRVVRSRLGRCCPPPSAAWREVIRGSAGGDPDALDGADAQNTLAPDDARVQDGGTGLRSAQAARARGRFTRNFVIQASAADWALVLLVVLRRRLAELGPAPPDPGAAQLVFFVHDEVVVHTPKALAAQVAEAVTAAAAEATRLVFGDTPVFFPMQTAIVDCYADAK
jgi:DNA polymerase-1